MPIGIREDAHDKYGQITGQHLNTVLEYKTSVEYEYANELGGNKIETTPDGPEFSFLLNSQIELVFILISVNVQIKIYQECVDDISEQLDYTVSVRRGGYPRCVGCKFILVHILLYPYLRTLRSHLMSYMYHILP